MYDTKIYAYEFIPSHKKRDPKVSFKEYSVFILSTDCRSLEWILLSINFSGFMYSINSITSP